LRTLRKIMAGAIIAVTAIAAPAPAAAAPSGPPYNALTLTSAVAEGSPLYGQTHAFDNGNATLSMQSWGPVGIQFMASNDSQDWMILAQPPTGSDWAAGTYEVASGHTPTAAMWSVGGNGSRCGHSIPGSLVVHEFARDPQTQLITVFAASFDTPCESRPSAVIGELRWNSTLGYKALTASPSLLSFGAQGQGALGPAKTVTFTASGTESIVIGQISVQGRDSGSFVVQPGENCSGRSLSPGQTCQVSVRARANYDYNNAQLVLPANVPGGKLAVALIVQGVYRNVFHAPSNLDLGTTPLGEITVAKTVTVTVGGQAPVPFGEAELGGLWPEAFTITGDTCAGQTVQPGQTCTVSVAGVPPISGELQASLLIPETDIGFTRQIPVKVVGWSALGTYFPSGSSRFLDTRFGLGAPAGVVGPGGTRDLQITGRLDTGWVPAVATAVVLNVTVTGPTAESFVSVYPTGVPRPHTSSLNFTAGWTGANSVTVKIGTDGKVTLFNAAGSVHLIVDVLGFYADQTIGGPGSLFHPAEPSRLFDSRTDWDGKVEGDSGVVIAADFGPAVNSKVRAFAVNITAVDGSGEGYLAAWNGLGEVPVASTLNYQAGQVVPNMAIVPTALWNGYPSIGVYTTTDVHFIVDIVGYFGDPTLVGGLRFEAITPTRIMDTRTGGGAIGPGQYRTVTAPGTVANADTIALSLNVTGVLPSQDTFLTVWADGDPRPGVSNLNPGRGKVTPNAAITLVDTDNQFNVFNSVGSTHVLADAVGRFYFHYVIWIPGVSADSAATEKISTWRPPPVNVTPHAVKQQ
jgi:hypothetical protein